MPRAFGEPPTRADMDYVKRKHDELHGQVHIDKHDLDNEFATQAEKYRDVLDVLRLTISYEAAAKDHFDRIEADISKEIRAAHEAKHAGTEKVPRLTDTAVREELVLDDRWMEAKALRRDWEDMLVGMQHLREVFSQRSSNMKEMPTLYSAGYWTTDSARPRTTGEAQHVATRRELDHRREQRHEERPAEQAPGRRRPTASHR